MSGRLERIRARPARAVALTGTATAIAVLALMLLRSGGPTYEVTAVFDQVDGLVPGADVEVAGVKEGSVESIAIGSDGLPHVTLEIDDGFRLRQGAVADLRAASASGEVNRFITLTQGSGPELGSGATLGLARTDQPVEVGQVLSTLDSSTRGDVRTALRGLDTATSGRGADLAAILRNSAGALGNTAELVRQVNRDGDALRTLVASGGQVVHTLARDPNGLGSTADRLASVLATTASRQRDLARSAARLPKGLQAPREALDRLDASVGTLRRVVALARPGIASLVPFAKDLRPALISAQPALAAARRLVGDAPGDLRALSPLLDTAKPTLRTMTPALRSAEPILNEARVRTPDFFSFFSNWADFTSVYDANGHAARVGLVMPPAPTNSIGPSDSGAGSLAAPFLRTPGVLEGQPWTDYRKSFIGRRPGR
jgi:virulence factor Mce-like protein